jgi:hypothetical protein
VREERRTDFFWPPFDFLPRADGEFVFAPDVATFFGERLLDDFAPAEDLADFVECTRFPAISLSLYNPEPRQTPLSLVNSHEQPPH